MGKKTKRILALLLSLCLCIQYAAAFEGSTDSTDSENAASISQSYTEDDVSGDDTSSDAEATPSEGEAAPSAEKEIPSDIQPDPVESETSGGDNGTLPTDEAAETAGQAADQEAPVSDGAPAEDAGTVQEAPMASGSGSDAAQENLPLLSYVLVNSPALTTPDTQEVLIGIGDASILVEQAVLTVRNQSTGEAVSYEAAELTSGAALFRMAYDAGQAGTYTLESLRYTYGGVETVLNFDEIGIDASYGVDAAVENEPDAFVVEDSSASETADVVFDVSTLDDGGAEVLADSVESALSDASGLESGLAAALSLGETAGTLSTGSSSGNVVVVLDPGHDDTHGGTSGTTNGVKYKEQDYNLKIAQYCKAALERYAGVTVYMTRESASCPSGANNATDCNAWRVEYAQSVGADYYVSIHLNSFTSSSAHGAVVFYPNSNYRPDLGADGKGLAQEIQDQLVALGLYDRGVQIRNSEDNTLYPDGSLADYYGVIRRCKEAGIVGIIVEHAFMTSSSDFANFLSSDEKLKQLGEADATGIASYLGLSLSSGGSSPTTVYNGVDYAAVYDYEYYYSHYADLRSAFGADPAALLRHFVTYGMAEGRRASDSFDVTSYRNQYADLRRAYGNDLKSYYMHYINDGQREGRQATGCTELMNAITTYNGVDYSAVYDYHYYISHYSDLESQYSGDDAGLLRYFVTTGMAAGQRASEGFDVVSYRNQYVDLRRAYGDDLKSYYLHYINHGQAEGRQATGCTELMNAVTTYNGVDYAPVYNYNYYINRYPDLKLAYDGDEYGLLLHFINFGMDEGRTASENFDVTYYWTNYADLREAFGDDLKSYYVHYLNFGQQEGRVADRLLSSDDVTANHPIMGSNSVTAAQMAAFFNSKNKSFDSAAYGMTLEQFCQIYLEEAAAEGVDVLVAFSQAILETGYFASDKALNQFNFCGLGAVDSSASGANFNTSDYGATAPERVRMGVRAHIQHLKAYGSTQPLNNECVDPRFQLVSRGSAVYVENLGNGKWASDPDYASKILNIMNQIVQF